jgi:glycine hydroxymethyltransferase
MNDQRLAAFAAEGFALLRLQDSTLDRLLAREHERQNNSLNLVAASGMAHPSVVACESTVLGNVVSEGYPGKRFHAGCAVLDEIEQLAVDRAKAAFKAQYANVQPHSGTSANQVILFTLLKPGDRILSLDLDSGGHLTHGAPASATGHLFQIRHYGLDPEGLIDYESAARLAVEFQPHLIICGASAYPRIVDFARFRSIADSVGAYLLADISHIAGLVAAGLHPSPVDHAHFTTMSTYKQLCGPKGGLILSGKDAQFTRGGQPPLSQRIQRGVFPFFQGTSHPGMIAGKARALHLVVSPEFRVLATRIVEQARVLANSLGQLGCPVITGGTDNHTVLLSMEPFGITGLIAEKALEEVQILTNRNRIPNDTKPPHIATGLRLGTNAIVARELGTKEITRCAQLIHCVFKSVRAISQTEYDLDPVVKDRVRSEVSSLCRDFPIPHYSTQVERGASLTR